MRITLYKGCAIVPDKNMMVDEVESYLNTLDKYEVPNPNYVKNDLNILLTVNLSQEYFEGVKFNYCRIETDSRVVYYYFITNATWKSANAVQFSLNIDSINTFRGEFEGKWNEKTNVLRQHEDRYKKVAEGKYQRVINEVSEGIQGVQELIKDHEIDREKATDWYLVYKTTGDIDPNNPTQPLPVECNLMPDFPLIYQPEGHSVVGTIQSIKKLDRTDPKLIRIIACPYCPIPLVYDETRPIVVELPPNVEFSNGLLIIKQDQIFVRSFRRTIKADGFFFDLMDFHFNPKDTDLKNVKYESKLYHSDFRTERFQYDSFYRDIALERVTTVDDGYFNVKYVQSSDYNSNLLFKLEYPDYKRKDIYDNYLICKRNNERPILNSSYFNYLRNGYNYDKKNLDISQAKAGLGLVGSLITLGAGIVGAAATGGTSLLVSLGAIAGGATGVFSAAASMTQNASNFEQKQKQLQDTAAGVATSDDFSLLLEYNDNKLHHYTLALRPRDEKIVWDYFYYLGYKKEERCIPNYNSRIWFNFIQCQPEFNENEINKVAVPYLADIKARFAAGVTVYHKRKDQYDFEQIKENWEKSLID